MASPDIVIPVLVGPTGVGKTATAIKLAQQFNFELISADSRQVYTGMDIGTGKEAHLGYWQDMAGWPVLVIDGVPIHGLNLTTPDKPYSIADWHQHTQNIIDQIYHRHHQPLIVGGTGFYLQALLGKVTTLSIPPNAHLRQQLAALSATQLFNTLTKLDPNKAQTLNYSDQNNPARLIRLIEIHHSPQANSSHLQPPASSHPAINLKLIGLTMPRPDLYAKSDQRTEQMIDQGLIKEVQHLTDRYGFDHAAFKTIGYAEIIKYLQGHLTQQQAIQAIKHHNHHYIRRQYTWFNKQPVNWVDTSTSNIHKHITDLLAP